jgi:hypothetical protein
VEVAGAAVDELLDELGDVGAGSPLSGEVADLLLGGDLAGQEEPEETFWERLLATGGLREELLAFGDLSHMSSGSRKAVKNARTYGLAAEADTLLRVKN